MVVSESLRDKSKRNWSNDSDSNENIMLGSILRIADATEKMAVNWKRLQDELEYTQRQLRAEMDRCKKLERSNAAYRGMVKRCPVCRKSQV